MTRGFRRFIAMATLLGGCPGADECQSGFECAVGETCVLDDGGNRCETAGDGDGDCSDDVGSAIVTNTETSPAGPVYLNEQVTITATVSEAAACCTLSDVEGDIDDKEAAGGSVTFTTTMGSARFSDGSWGDDYTITCDNNVAGAETFRIAAHPPATFSLSISANDITKTASVSQTEFPVVSSDGSVTAEYQAMNASACISNFGEQSGDWSNTPTPVTLTAPSEDFTLSCDGFNFLDETDMTGNTLRVGVQGDIPTATVYFDDLATASLTLSQYVIGDDSANISVDEVHNLVPNVTEGLPAIVLGEGCEVSDGTNSVVLVDWEPMGPQTYRPFAAGMAIPVFSVDAPTNFGLQCLDSFARPASSADAQVTPFAIEDLPPVSWTDWSQPVTIGWTTTEPALDCEVAGSNFGVPVAGEDEGGGVQWSASITPTDDVDDLEVTCNAAGGLVTTTGAVVNVRATITQWEVTTLQDGEGGCANINGCIAATWTTAETRVANPCDLFVQGVPLAVSESGTAVVYDINDGGAGASKVFDLICYGETADGDDVTPLGGRATKVWFGNLSDDTDPAGFDVQYVTGALDAPVSSSNASVWATVVEVGGLFDFSNTDNASLEFPDLLSIGGDFTVSGNTSLATIDFSALNSINGNFTFSNSAFDSGGADFEDFWSSPTITLADTPNILIQNNISLSCIEINIVYNRFSFGGAPAVLGLNGNLNDDMGDANCNP